MTGASLGMAAATSVGPALMNVARAAGSAQGGSRSHICAVARSGASNHLHHLRGGRFLLSRRRFLLGTGTAVTGGMLGMASSVPPKARAGVSEAEEVLRNVQWPEQFPFSKEDFARYDE